MPSLRVRSTASSVLLLVGALLVGDAIHGAVVVGTYPLLSPASVLRIVVGAGLLVAGYRLRTPPLPDLDSDGERVGGPPSEERVEESEYDPRLSPLGDATSDDAPGDDAPGDDAPDDDRS